ncbi:uncharacterized protein Smp_204090 [Schistosoma mansoni]|uniref:uncharacterized protein n=1 Tax=Schistosoma mansoni TaxID=6183 RepID=UPI00022DCB65|nr:uncharacterized protein Smp_204090 [Schistosoma mansoni]|eukprot:XP_018654184.1 uncharacterized protein Smp_204090 [Schistosoma mansoni]
MGNLASLLVLIRLTRPLESRTPISASAIRIYANRLFQAYFVYITDRQTTPHRKIENNICTEPGQMRL